MKRNSMQQCITWVALDHGTGRNVIGTTALLHEFSGTLFLGSQLVFVLHRYVSPAHPQAD